MSPPLEPDPLPEHVRATFYTPPSRSLYNVHRALMPCVSLTFSVSLCLPLRLLARAWAQLCQRDGHCWPSGPPVTQGGIFVAVGWGLWRDPEINNAIFKIQIFHLKSPLPICNHKILDGKHPVRDTQPPSAVLFIFWCFPFFSTFFNMFASISFLYIYML